jgi:hypothetical protein
VAPKSWSTHAGATGGADGGDIGGAGGPAGGSGGIGSAGGGSEGKLKTLPPFWGDEGGGCAESPPPHAQHLRVGS